MEKITTILKYWKYIVMAILLGIGIWLYFALRSAVADKERYYGNTIELNKTFLDAKGKFVSEVSAKVLTIDELNKRIASGDSNSGKLLQQIKDMGLKLKKIESAGSIIFETKDTIFVPKLVFVGKIHCFDYTDGFMTLNITGDSLGTNIKYNYKDNLTWAASTYFIDKWKFKNLFKRRAKYLKIDAKFDNPKSEIKYQEFIKIKK